MKTHRIGIYIKSLRTSKYLTQQELADKTGLSKSYISGIEKGVKTPRIEQVEKIAKVLMIPVSILLLVSYGESDLDNVDFDQEDSQLELAKSIENFKKAFNISTPVEST